MSIFYFQWKQSIVFSPVYLLLMGKNLFLYNFYLKNARNIFAQLLIVCWAQKWCRVSCTKYRLYFTTLSPKYIKMENRMETIKMFHDPCINVTFVSSHVKSAFYSRNSASITASNKQRKKNIERKKIHPKWNRFQIYALFFLYIFLLKPWIFNHYYIPRYCIRVHLSLFFICLLETKFHFETGDF